MALRDDSRPWTAILKLCVALPRNIKDLVQCDYDMCNDEIIVRFRTRDGQQGRLAEPVHQFPSPTLVTQLLLVL